MKEGHIFAYSTNEDHEMWLRVIENMCVPYVKISVFLVTGISKARCICAQY